MAYTAVVGTYTDTVVQLARDTLSGYSGDYIFFQTTPFSGYDQTFQLILCDRLDSSGNFDTLTGYADTFYSVIFNIDSSGDIVYWYIPFQSESVVLSRNGSLVYSSLEHMPQLVEGGAKYGYLQAAIMCGAIVFYLCNRIFRRVSVC